ncbi:MAG: M56 family metallopeptidase [Desulfitobacteriaceae bacterium]|jgi:bla regulator protein BlaR1|nr:M56 family metallopeptidase [Desulfitobacteriaceae bacterium]
MTEIIFQILALSISMTPIIAALLLLTPLFNKWYISNCRYWIWLAVSLRLLFPFSVGTSAPAIFNIAFNSAENSAAINNLAQEAITFGNDLPGAAIGTNFSPGVIEVMLILYLLGVLLYLINSMSGYLSFSWIINKRANEPANDGIYRAINEISMQKGLNIKADLLKVLISKGISGPMVIGLLRPVLLLPHENYSDTQLKVILTHELVHIKRHDITYKTLLLLVCALHWFNPLVHIMAKKANRDIEITCDSIALRETGVEEKKLYSLTIIEMAARNCRTNPPAISSGFKTGKESLENRVKNIFDFEHKGKGTGALIIIVLVLLVCSSFIRISTISPTVANASATPIFEQNASIPTNVDTFDYAASIDEVNSKVTESPYSAVNANNGNLAQLKTETTAIPKGQTMQTDLQPVELVIIDLKQLNSENTIDITEENSLTD